MIGLEGGLCKDARRFPSQKVMTLGSSDPGSTSPGQAVTRHKASAGIFPPQNLASCLFTVPAASGLSPLVFLILGGEGRRQMAGEGRILVTSLPFFKINNMLKCGYIQNLAVLLFCYNQFRSVAQWCLTLRPHGLQHAKPPYPSPTPGACSNSCPSSQCCQATISSSVFPFSSCPQSFPASESFPRSWLFASGGQRIGASASVLLMTIQG